MKKKQILILIIAIFIAIVPAFYFWQNLPIESPQEFKIQAQVAATENFFSVDDMKTSLKDHGQLIHHPISEVNEASLDKLKQLFLDGNQYELDKFIKAYMLDTNISRNEKISTLIGLLETLGDENQSMYILDILATLHPIEFSSQLINFYNRHNTPTLVRERTLMTLGKAFLFTPSNPPDPKDAALLNAHINKIQNFIKEQVYSPDPSIKRAALAEYVRALPQNEVAQTLNNLLDQSGFSFDDKTQLKINAALTERSSIQSLIFNEILAGAKQPENEAAVKKQMIGVLTGVGVDDILTQDTKYLLQGYLKSKEPTLLNASGSMTIYSEYNEWLTAMAAAHATGKNSTIQWTADYFRQLHDPLKLAIGIGLATDATLSNLNKNFALTSIEARIKAGKNLAAKNQVHIFDAAITRIGKAS